MHCKDQASIKFIPREVGSRSMVAARSKEDDGGGEL
jgi:hypothetical protein